MGAGKPENLRWGAATVVSDQAVRGSQSRKTCSRCNGVAKGCDFELCALACVSESRPLAVKAAKESY